MNRHPAIKHEGRRYEHVYNEDLQLLSAVLSGPRGRISMVRTESDHGWTASFTAEGSSETERLTLSLPDHLVFAYMRERVA